MANYSSLLAAVNAAITANGTGAITGPVLNTVLQQMIVSLGQGGYIFKGRAIPTTDPNSPDQNVFYIATTPGTYTNFSSIVVAAGECAILKGSGTSWSKEATGIDLVSVSQNTSTGHTDINIGSDSYPVASVEEVSQLGQEVEGNYISSIISNEDIFNQYSLSGYINTSGGVSENESYRYTPYVGLSKVRTSIVAKSSVSGGALAIAFYDENFDFISGVAGIGSMEVFSPVCPASAKYARFTAKESDINSSYYGYLGKKVSSIDLYVIGASKEYDVPACFTNSNGDMVYNAGYRCTNFIQVVPGEQVSVVSSASGGVRVIAFYDENFGYISGVAGTGTLATHQSFVPQNAKYAIFCSSVNDTTSYFGYSGGSGVVNKSIHIVQGHDVSIIESASLVGPNSINNGVFPGTLKKGQVLALEADLPSSGLGQGFRIGFGFSDPSFCFVQITDTEITVVKSLLGTVETIQHGVTFSDFISVLITSLNDGRAKIYIRTLNSSYGGILTKFGWDFNGMPNVYALDTTTLNNCKFSIGNTDLRKPIWVFGDSYWNYWAGGLSYNLSQMGYQNICMCARGGQDSAGSFDDLNKLLAFNRPKYIVWALGMNDSYSDWLSYLLKVQQICKDYGIEFIGVTIPTARSTNYAEKQQMTDYIRCCGCRYVDIYKALGCNANAEWYNNGQENDFQGPDGIHASAYAGPYMAMQYLMDFPEICQYNNMGN